MGTLEGSIYSVLIYNLVPVLEIYFEGNKMHS